MKRVMRPGFGVFVCAFGAVIVTICLNLFVIDGSIGCSAPGERE
jgi:hypothetical protein